MSATHPPDDSRSSATKPAGHFDPSRIVSSGLAAAIASSAVLAWRGKAELDSTAAANNAPSQYVHGQEALLHDEPSWSYTAMGLLVHTTMSLLWASAFEFLQSRRRHLRRLAWSHAVTDASLVTTVAAIVDLQVVPDRWSPGFQHRLSATSTALVYVGFAAGLVMASRFRR